MTALGVLPRSMRGERSLRFGLVSAEDNADAAGQAVPGWPRLTRGAAAMPLAGRVYQPEATVAKGPPRAR